MGRKIKSTEDGGEIEVDDTTPIDQTPIIESPESNVDPVSAATPIVNLDDEITKESAPVEQQQNGVYFWFGHVGLLKFPDKSEYHVRSNRVFVTDPVLIANLTELAKNPSHKIFPQ